MKTVVGLYDEISHAREVVEDLVDAGFARDNISLVARDQTGEYAPYFNRTDTAVDTIPGDAAAEGAVAGGVIGGLAGVLLGLGLFAIPGIGPVIGAGPLVAGLIGAGVGAATGGLLGALVDWGVPETEAGYYTEGVRRGGTLVAVKTDEANVDRVTNIMNSHGPVDIEQRSASWREAGWTGDTATVEPSITTELKRQDYLTSDMDDYATYEPTFRRHYQTNYAASGYPYERYQSAYRYAYDLATDTRYRDWDWDRVEPEARRGWEGRNQGLWEDFKDAVRQGWEEVKDAFDADDDDLRQQY